MDKPHRQLEVWQKSMDFTIALYRSTNEFPVEERYGLVTQMRRAAVSTPINLAEGAARSTTEFVQFIRIALGSISELDTQLEICCRLGYLSEAAHADLDQKLVTIDRMMLGLRKSLLAKSKNI